MTAMPAGESSQSPVRIRTLIAADLDAVIAIERQIPEAPHWKTADYEALLQPADAAPLCYITFAAEAGGQLIGFAAARLLLDGEQNICELESIAVLASARRTGAGSSLLQAVTERAQALGGRRLQLEVRAGNTTAIAFYEHAGLLREGVRPRYYAAPEEDALLMGREIRPLPGAVEKSPKIGLKEKPPRC
ncbi:GNAT family N-acetyltransferase [Paracidobacterium acidisoli]|uniref:GNAT family N-acetyltransferase n=1 Tax=Paracidobacterium acidisoli TaxID=2303751 RepID=A0A372ISX2_9BACT|nr:GNAT family N-acetyltransferase [Paracidobacterium acidisoli]MBT9329427.1 GNAT family N-acetyltransferase [Paracidobacterium acidisoli]